MSASVLGEEKIISALMHIERRWTFVCE
jgi:hypothetical protein